jgi:hypothetical protein
VSDYFVEDTEKLPFATSVKIFERHLPHFLAVWLAWWLRFRKRIGFPVRPVYATRWDPLLKWHTREDMPAQALSRWSPLIEQLEDLGFTVCGWLISDTIGPKKEASACFLNDTGNILATVLWLQICDVERTQLSLVSYRNDGTEILTAALPEDQQMMAAAITPDFVDLICEAANTSPGKLIRIHSRHPALTEAMHFSCDSLKRHFQQQRIRFFEFARDSGLLRPLSEGEIRSVNG